MITGCDAGGDHSLYGSTFLMGGKRPHIVVLAGFIAADG